MATKRRPVIAGNWKLHLTGASSEALAVALAAELGPVVAAKQADIIIAPGFCALGQVHAAIAHSGLQLAAQTLFFADEGAYTGEVSGGQLRAAGCSHVIVGHSERRGMFGETDAGVRMRVVAATRHQLVPIVCVGETSAERQAGRTDAILGEQLLQALGDAPTPQQLLIAYEPVWAIGTGQSATAPQAQATMHALRQRAAQQFGESWAQQVRLLYGGSAKAQNAAALLAEADIDGLLVGGASLSAEQFVPLVRAAVGPG